MAMKKVVDPALIGACVAGAENQVISAGTPKSDDPNFPVFRTPLEKDLIVYFPKVCVQNVDGKEVYNPLYSHAHSVRKGAKQYLTYRCISGLSGGAYESLGYDGSCPFCDGIATCWELYNEKMARKAAELGIDLNNDANDSMKPFRTDFLNEMVIKRAEEYVTFPIVIISDTGAIPQSLEAATLEAQYVTMRRDTFEQKIMEPLTKQAVPIPHPGGMFFKWCYTYDTKGKQANVRDAAKNAQYLPIVDMGGVTALQPFVQAAEAKAAGFTNTQAAAVVIMNQFYEKADLEKEADLILADTNRTLSVLKGSAPTAAAALPAGGTTATIEQTLSAFGVPTAQIETTAQPAVQPNGQPITPAQMMGQPVAPAQMMAQPVAPTATPTTAFTGFGA